VSLAVVAENDGYGYDVLRRLRSAGMTESAMPRSTERSALYRSAQPLRFATGRNLDHVAPTNGREGREEVNGADQLLVTEPDMAVGLWVIPESPLSVIDPTAGALTLGWPEG